MIQPSGSMIGETVIVAALRTGNVHRALELMLDCYQDEVYGYCLTLAGTSGVGEIFPKVLAKAIEGLAGFQPHSSVRAWLYSIARQAVIHYHRSNHQDHDGSLHPDYGPVAGPVKEPAGAAEDLELGACLEILEVPVREVLQLSLWYGLQLSEVAHVTGRTENEVRQLAVRGLTTLAAGLRYLESPPS